MHRHFVIGVLVLCLSSLVVGRKKSYYRYQVLRIKHERDPLLDSLFESVKGDVWHAPTPGFQVYDVLLSPGASQEVLTQLSFRNVTYEVFIDDVQALIDGPEKRHRRRHRRRPHALRFNEYNSYHKIMRWMRRFSRENRDILTLLQVGTTSQGNTIFALKFSTGSGTKPVFWQDSLIHAREWITGATLLWVIDRMVTLYRQGDQEVTKLLRHMDWYFLPVWNVDGYIYTRRRDRMWRKSRSSSDSSICLGVDLNRNFKTPNWEGDVTSNNECSRVYHGTHEFSEEETMSVAGFLRSIPIAAMISLHSYAQFWLYPYGYQPEESLDQRDLDRVSSLAVKTMQERGGAKYKHGSVQELAYEVSGGSIDWAHRALCVKYSFGVELRDRGRYGFLLPARFILPTSREYYNGMMSVANSVLEQAGNLTSSICIKQAG